MLFTNLFNKSVVVNLAVALCSGLQMSHAMDHYENERVEKMAKFAGQCVSCYNKSTPTHIVGCTQCPTNTNEELNSFLRHLHTQEDMYLIRKGANFQPYLPHLDLTDFPALNNVPPRPVFQMPPLQQMFALPPMVFPPIALIYFPINQENDNA